VSFVINPYRFGATVNFPTVVSTNIGNNIQSTYAMPLPASLVSGNLLILICRAGLDTTTISTPADWALLGSRSSGGVTYVFTKTSDGSEGSTVTVTPSEASRISSCAYQISGWTNKEVTFAGSDTEDPPSATASWGSTKNLWLPFVSSRETVVVDLTGAPTNYTNYIEGEGTAQGTNRACVASARRALEAATEDPGAFTYTGTLTSPHAGTIVIGP